MEELNAVKGEKASLASALENEKGKNASLAEKLSILNEENNYLARTLEEKSSLEPEVQRLKKALATAENDRASLSERLHKAQQGLAQAQQQGDREEDRQAQTALAEVQRAYDALVAQHDKTRSLLHKAQQERDDLETRLSDSLQANQKLRAQMGLYRTINAANRNDTGPNTPIASRPASQAAFPSHMPESSGSSSQIVDLSRLLSYSHGDDDIHRSSSVTSQLSALSPASVSRSHSIVDGMVSNPSHSQSQMEKAQELLAAHKQIRHLRELLKEAEGNIMRLEEQQGVLKEEVRRLERNQKREQGINLEYLKNILFKFLEAEQENERRPLLLVFAQMLQFSPEEMSKLTGAQDRYENRLKQPQGWGPRGGWF
eukprot:comp23691_c0_seq1/m.40676 comp23691_c0_seq1/g.40676  ORF comp23691_c0_seq1/g.40676 comp23691_c0_seq1/m.40676 type:complete len:372 (-) comp23691_c0_seq1:467-1582(-)